VISEKDISWVICEQGISIDDRKAIELYDRNTD
jgi:hypothetical protein